MATDTRSALLAAAEKILVEQGVNALTVRKIGIAAELNPTLVTYHFKTMFGLLDELCSLNLDPMLDDWRSVAQDDDAQPALDDILRAWLTPLLRPAAFTPSGRALVVLDEIAAHGEAALQAKVLDAMLEFGERLRAVIAPLLPHLCEHELRARFRFISGAVIGPPPRTRGETPTDGTKRLDDLAYLLPFARAALIH